MKKITLFALSALIVFAFCGCNIPLPLQGGSSSSGSSSEDAVRTEATYRSELQSITTEYNDVLEKEALEKLLSAQLLNLTAKTEYLEKGAAPLAAYREKLAKASRYRAEGSKTAPEAPASLSDAMALIYSEFLPIYFGGSTELVYILDAYRYDNTVTDLSYTTKYDDAAKADRQDRFDAIRKNIYHIVDRSAYQDVPKNSYYALAHELIENEK